MVSELVLYPVFISSPSLLVIDHVNLPCLQLFQRKSTKESVTGNSLLTGVCAI